jgi:uncharacterized protein with von Willebrand factor type A (vWA) domain
MSGGAAGDSAGAPDRNGGSPGWDDGLPARVESFLTGLRAADVPVAMADALDARRALGVIDWRERWQVREALAACVMDQPGHRGTFDRLFDVYFPASLGAEAGPREPGELLDALASAIIGGDTERMHQLADEAVATFGAMARRDGLTGYASHRVTRTVKPGGLRRRLLEVEGRPDDDDLDTRLRRAEVDRAVQAWQNAVEEAVRRRLAEVDGAEQAARSLGEPLPEDRDLLRVSAAEAAAVRVAVRPLARRLAARLASKQRRARRGQLDALRTLRAAMTTGGVPIEPVLARRRPQRPELVLVCDVSSSVAEFARFTLLLCHAIQGQMVRVRSFAFVDALDEITALFADDDAEDAFARLWAEARVVRFDGRTDYRAAFAALDRDYHDAITPRSTVIVLGDARNNYRAAGADELAALADRAKRLYWLNPEPRAQWDGGDSLAGAYARHADQMVECRTLRQLAGFIETLA